MIEAATTQGPAAVIERLLPKMLAAATISSQPEVVGQVREMARSQSVEGIVAGIKALRDRPDATAGLSHISIPTLVLVGEEDSITPPEKAQAMANAIPDSHLAMLSSCGHLSNLEDPHAFNTVVRRFVDELPNETRGSRTV